MNGAWTYKEIITHIKKNTMKGIISLTYTYTL